MWRLSSIHSPAASSAGVSAHAGLVLDALEQALHDRRPLHRGGLVHHRNRGSQYVSIKYTERLVEAGIEPSVGSVGDSYDNALAETINGLYKAEVIRRRGPWRSLEAVEFATLEWADWFNHRRLLQPIGNIPPAEAEQRYFAMLDQMKTAARFNTISLRQTRGGSLVKRSDQAKAFTALPKRWVVERTFAWLNRCRRLAKHWECLNRKARAFLLLASVRLMLRRLARSMG
jgi:transposase